MSTRQEPTSPSDELDDAQLLERERSDRAEFRRLQAEQPRFRDTTFGVVRGSALLVSAWERWWDTNLAARMRGILGRTIER